MNGLDLHYSLDSFKGGQIGDYIGGIIRIARGDTRSLDYRKFGVCLLVSNKMVACVSQFMAFSIRKKKTLAMPRASYVLPLCVVYFGCCPRLG